MKIINVKANKIDVAGLLFIVMIWLASVFYVIGYYEKEKQNYVQSESVLLQSEIDSIAKSYERFSSYIFTNTINQPEVLDLFYKASLSDGAERDFYRKKLYDLLLKDYDAITAYNFRQLHFHFKNGDSFLRFHSPDLYGDNLFSVRDSIRIANLEQRYVFGFEEGRIFNGFRFVWPLVYKDVHVGSVEVSVSLGSAIEALAELYPNNNIMFILKRSVVEGTVFKQQQSNYIPSFLSEDYVIDRDVFKRYNHYSGNRFQPFEQKEIVDQVRQKAHSLSETNEPLSFDLSYKDESYLVQFLPIQSINQKTVGYYVSFKKENRGISLQHQMRKELVLLTVLFMMVLVSFSLFVWDRRKVAQLAAADHLTGIFNRHKFAELSEKELARCIKENKPLSVIFLDIDHFKRINDTHGHDIGDTVLKSLVNLIKANLRDSDVFARWGGEEFIILMPEVGADSGGVVAERLRKLTADFIFDDVGQVTISLGVVERQPMDKTVEDIIQRADQALYTAKESGRNRVSLG